MSDQDVLAPYRSRLDELDRELLELVAARMQICLDIARVKAEHAIPMMQTGRVSLVLDRARGFADGRGLREEYLVGLFEQIIRETCVQEDLLIAAQSSPAGSAPEGT